MKNLELWYIKEGRPESVDTDSVHSCDDIKSEIFVIVLEDTIRTTIYTFQREMVAV